MTVSDFMDAIESGDPVAAEQSFNAAMADRLRAAIENLRVDIAQTKFGLNNPTQEEEDSDV